MNKYLLISVHMFIFWIWLVSTFWKTLIICHLLSQLSNQHTSQNECIKMSGTGIIYYLKPDKTYQGRKHMFFNSFMNNSCNKWANSTLLLFFYMWVPGVCSFVHVWIVYCCDFCQPVIPKSTSTDLSMISFKNPSNFIVLGWQQKFQRQLS